MIRILICDDHPVVREGLVAILETQPDFQIVGVASDGHQAVALAQALQPDVILLDLEMPGLDGLEALRAIHVGNPAARVIVFTAYDTDGRILGAIQAGARGYLLKGAPREELFHAVRVVHAGGSLLEPEVASRLIRRASQMPLPEPLTERETEVLRLMAQGLQNKEIASRLIISERTVKFHVSAILAKLGAGNRTEAVALAHQLSLVDL